MLYLLIKKGFGARNNSVSELFKHVDFKKIANPHFLSGIHIQYIYANDIKRAIHSLEQIVIIVCNTDIHQQFDTTDNIQSPYFLITGS